MNKWLQATRKLDTIGAEKVPEGWITMTQFMEEVGLSMSHAQKKMIGLLDAGLAESKKFKIQTKRRRGLYAVPHYRLK